MAGQPQGFAVAKVISTEPVTATAPALVVQAGDSIKMKTYLRVGPTTVGSVTVTPSTSERRDVRIALVGGTIGGVPVPATGSLEYHFQDLETGAVVPSIAGGTIIELNATSAPSRAAVLGAGGDLAGFPDGPENDYYLSPDTLPITTGDSASTATLKTPAGGGGAGSESGTWRVLTHAHGGAGTEVSSFDDDLLITVIN
jgi:hypothetical protein